MDLSLLLHRFLIAKDAAGRSQRTLDSYQSHIETFLDWLDDNSIERRVALEPETIERFLAEQRRKRLAGNTIRGRYRALSAWCGWLVRRHHIEHNPMDDIECPQVPKRPVEHVEITEFLRLYQAIHLHNWVDLRDRCILLILFWSGLRVSELTGLTLGDVDTSRRLITVRHGKGGKGRVVPCPPELCEVLLDYLYARPPYNGEELFVGNDGAGGVRGPFTEWGVRLMLRRRFEAAGLPYRNPHKFRHGFGMTMLNAGMEIKAVSTAMGHSSVRVTEDIYARWLLEPLQREYEQARNRANETPALNDG